MTVQILLACLLLGGFGCILSAFFYVEIILAISLGLFVIGGFGLLAIVAMF